MLVLHNCATTSHCQLTKLLNGQGVEGSIQESYFSSNCLVIFQNCGLKLSQQQLFYPIGRSQVVTNLLVPWTIKCFVLKGLSLSVTLVVIGDVTLTWCHFAGSLVDRLLQEAVV